MTEEQNKVIAQYDAFAERHNAAYAAFVAIHETKYPRPALKSQSRGVYFMLIWLVVIVGASVVVSGTRTVEEFGGGIVGYAAFVMIEATVITYSFYKTQAGVALDNIESKQRAARRSSILGLMLSILVALGANIHAVLRWRGIYTSDDVNTVINLAVAVSAPAMAWLSGDILAIEYLRLASRHKRAVQEYEERFQQWQDALNKSWSAQQKSWGVRIEVVSAQTDNRQTIDRQQTDGHFLSDMSVSEQTDSRQTGYGYTRTPDGQQKVMEYLALHPDDARLPARRLADLVGVGKDTANTARKIWIAGRHQTDRQ